MIDTIIKEIPSGEAFVQIPVSIKAGKTISFIAYGVLSQVLKMPNDWIFHREYLLKIAGISEPTLYKVLDELREAGLCTGKMRDENADGRNTLRFCAFPGALTGAENRSEKNTKCQTVKRKQERLDNAPGLSAEKLANDAI